MLRARCFQCGVERSARTHHSLALLGISLVVTTDIHSLALHRFHFGHDLGFIVGQCFGEGLELGGQLFVFRLVSKLLGPVHGQVELAAAVVEFTGFWRWRLIVVQ